MSSPRNACVGGYFLLPTLPPPPKKKKSTQSKQKHITLKPLNSPYYLLRTMLGFLAVQSEARKFFCPIIEELKVSLSKK